MLQLKGIFKDRLFLRIWFSFAPLLQKYNIQNNSSGLMQLWGKKYVQWQTQSMAYLHPDLILQIRAPSLLLLRCKVSKATALRVSITFEFSTLFSFATFGGSLLFEVCYFEAMLGNFALSHFLSLRKEKRLSRGLRVGDLL